MICTTTSLSNTQELENLSAEFWCNPDAIPENFNKTLSNKEYSLISLYCGKILNNNSMGISLSLKNKIIGYLNYNFNQDYIDNFFTIDEEKVAQDTLVELYNLDSGLYSSPITSFNYTKIKSLNFFTGRKSTSSLSRQFDLDEDNCELAKSYLSFLDTQHKNSLISFSMAEQKQVNVVLLGLSSLSKKELDIEINSLQRKIQRLIQFS